ncbi:MAG: 16S rRNA (guanine(527)-N(7))-methyltransferase RsmG [Armatimonadetes bacterium]|nr:16S rRNA (guanine(527)-N(7))-methyltransferase RsmG [Armatimonadota bacterium]
MTDPVPPASDWQRALRNGAAELNIALPEASLDRYRAYLDLLLADNRRASLTAITDPTEIATKHFLDSLTCLRIRDIAPGERIADIGSGAGFPGLVLAIIRPAHYTLIEATKKRAAFLQRATEALGIPDTTVIPSRAEEVGHDPDHREAYHLVLSRAVAPLAVLLEYALPLTRLGGHFIAYKGPAADEELDASGNALQTLGGRVAHIVRLALPREMGQRTLVQVEKTAPSPPRYPRRPGIPAKRPL